ncbi:MAG: SH3 domain-containing protein [Pyrinomonadaceae bacterium]
MKTLIPTLFLICSILSLSIHAQRQSLLSRNRSGTIRSPEIGKTVIVVDDTLSVLRSRPSLFAEPIQRMRRGRKIRILDSAEADGVKFYKVTAPPKNHGWVQTDAVFGRFRTGDEERLARLVQALDGFDQVEAAVEFFKLCPKSKYKASILLLFGDVIEEAAVQMSRQAGSRLSRKEMAASQAPMHSYYLNFNMLDRYRRLGVVFLFNPSTRQFHYSGASWREIVAKFPASPEASEANRRLDALNVKMQQTTSK